MAGTRLGIVFDFDGTLAPDSTSGFLEAIGIEVAPFWRECNRQIAEEGWDYVTVYLQKMIDLARDLQFPITRQHMEEYGRTIQPYSGVESFFSRLRAYVKELDRSAILEFYLISSGIETILKASPIAQQFNNIWGSNFAFDGEGRATGVKNVISFTEKTRYLYQISKGLTGPEARLDPYRVNDRIEREQEFHIRFDHMIYVGDGMTDVPCFALVKKYGGHAIGVYDPSGSMRHAKQLKQDKRVTRLVTAEFEPESEMETLMKSALKELMQI